MTASKNPSKNPWLIAVVSSLATFMEVLDSTIVTVSLAQISGTLGAGQDESTWVLTAYLVANAIVLPLAGWLSGVLGRKKYFLMSIVGFTIASFFCGSSSTLMMLVVFRLLQGVAGGGLQPTQQAIILDAFPPEKRGMAFGLVGITMVVAPILGPTLGGWITDNFNWRWVFFINVPVGIIAFLLVNRIVHDDLDAKATGFGKIDYIGLGLITTAVGVLQIILDKGQQEDWFESSFIITCAIISLLSGIAAVYWMLRQKEPVVELRLLKDRGFALSCLMIFVTGFSLYGGASLMPLMLQTQFGYNATLAGMVLSPGGIAVMCMMPLMGRITGLVQARYLVLFGMTLIGVGMFHSMFLSAQMSYEDFVFMRVLQVAGLPFLFIPISSLAFMNIPKHLNNKASAFYALARNVGGSVGIAIAATYVVRHQQVHQAYLSQHLSPYEPVFRSYLQDRIHHLGSQAAAMGATYRELLHQSALLAYIDVYQLMVILTLAAACLAIFMPANKPGAGKGKPPVEAH